MSDTPLVHNIAVTVHGRYLVRPPQSSPARGLLVGFHGYGENADIHLQNLRGIPGTESWTIAAVQGLHPFYNARTDTVVANWMTRQDRESAIEDNVRYVAAVVSELRRDYPAGPLVYAGFSQGVAMAFRAAAFSGHGSGGVIGLGGDIPPEITRMPNAGLPRVLLGRGEQDNWYTEEKLDVDRRFLASQDVPATYVTFAGGHEWTPEFSAAAASFLQRT